MRVRKQQQQRRERGRDGIVHEIERKQEVRPVRLVSGGIKVKIIMTTTAQISKQ